MAEFHTTEKRESPERDESLFHDDPELEKLVERAVRANQLHYSFRKRLEDKMKTRGEEAEVEAEAARLVYEQALKNLNAIRHANDLLETKMKYYDFGSDLGSVEHDGVLMEEETPKMAHRSHSTLTLSRVRRASLIPRFQGKTEG